MSSSVAVVTWLIHAVGCGGLFLKKQNIGNFRCLNEGDATKADGSLYLPPVQLKFLKNHLDHRNFPIRNLIPFASSWFRILFGISTNHRQDPNLLN